MNAEQLTAEILELIDAGEEDNIIDPVSIVEHIGDRYPEIPHEHVLKCAYEAYRRVAEQRKKEADRVQSLMDSPVGQWMKENPGMTLGDAMRKLGYWKEK